MGIGWIILILLILGIWGAVKAANNSNGGNSPQACPAGYYWNTIDQQCEIG